MDAAEVMTEGPTPWRRVSWRPGAEGAPSDFSERWECEVEWPLGGAMRIAILSDLCQACEVSGDLVDIFTTDISVFRVS